MVGIGGAALQANMQPMKTIFGAPSQLLFRGTEAFPCDSSDCAPALRQGDSGVGLLYFMPSYSAAASSTHHSGRALPQLSTRFCASLPKVVASSPDLEEGPQGSEPRLDAADAMSADAAAAAIGRKGKIPGAWSTGRMLSSVKKSSKMAMNLSIKLKGSRGGGQGGQDGSASREEADLGMLVAKRGCACVPCQQGAVPVAFSLRDPSQGPSPPIARQRSSARSFFRPLGSFHPLSPSMKARRVSDWEQQVVVTRAAPGAPPERENQTVHLPAVRAMGSQSPLRASRSHSQPLSPPPRAPSQLGPRSKVGGSSEPEWAETFAGEDRGQVMVAAEGYTFAAVYDGFMDCAAVDFLMTHLYPCLADELDALGIPPGMPCQHAHSLLPVHQEVLAALERAYEKVESAFFECVHRLHDEQPEMAVAGACVVVALVIGQHLYTLNVGDSAAVLVAEPPSSSSSSSLADNPTHSHSDSGSEILSRSVSGSGSSFPPAESGLPLAQSIPIGQSILSTAIPEDRSARSDQMALPGSTELARDGAELAEGDGEVASSFRSVGSGVVDSLGDLAAALEGDSDETNAGEDWGSVDAAPITGVARLTVEHNTNNSEVRSETTITIAGQQQYRGGAT